MPEINIKFNLPEESENLKITLAAQDLHSVIFDFKQELRGKLKHGEYKDKQYEMLDMINELLLSHLRENNVIELF